jgi:vacuolar-type H+-ATPase subunit F/Vma7
VIGDKDTVTGFLLAGIEVIVVNSKKEALTALQQAVSRQSIGIILITETFAGEIRKAIDDLLCFRQKCHLILQIPDTQRSLSDQHTLEEFALSALGIKI